MNKNNWQVKILKQVYAPLGNLSYSREFLTETPQRLKYIHYGDIHTNEIPEMISGQTYLPFLFDSTSISNEKKYLLQTGDLIITDASEDYEGVGKSVEVATISNEKIVAGLHTIALRPIDATNLAPGFGRYLLKHPLVSKRLKAIAQGTKVFSISFTLIQKLKILLPPIEEQWKIVEVLETWDKAIGLTKRLIEQKELQKKYLMQQLLTGRTRLKGFTGEWKESRLNKIKEVIIEKGKPLTKQQLKTGSIPVVAGGQETPYYHNCWTHDFPCITISASGAYAGFVRIHHEKIWASDCNVLYCTEYDLNFLYFCLKYQQGRLFYLQTGGAQGHVYAGEIGSLLLPNIPLPEQQAIANVLASCDKEIDLLKQKLTKLEEQKKGLMQILLTGEVRLIK